MCWILLLCEFLCVGIFCCVRVRVLLLCEDACVGVCCCMSACVLEFVCL